MRALADRSDVVVRAEGIRVVQSENVYAEGQKAIFRLPRLRYIGSVVATPDRVMVAIGSRLVADTGFVHRPRNGEGSLSLWKFGFFVEVDSGNVLPGVTGPVRFLWRVELDDATREQLAGVTGAIPLTRDGRRRVFNAVWRTRRWAHHGFRYARWVTRAVFWGVLLGTAVWWISEGGWSIARGRAHAHALPPLLVAVFIATTLLLTVNQAALLLARRAAKRRWLSAGDKHPTTA